MYSVGESKIKFAFNAPKPLSQEVLHKLYYPSDSDSDNDFKKSKPAKIISYECPLCASSSVKCNKCEIISLKLQVQQLKNELQKFYLIDRELLSISHNEKFLSTQFVTLRCSKPIEFEYKDALSLSHFVTITFDPARFGLQEWEFERKEYILHKWYILLDKHLINHVYGSFEYHKNGIIHCHAIINAQNENIKQINRTLRSFFTNNSKNKVVVQVGPAKYPQAQEYIEKESDDYFLIMGPSKHKKCKPVNRNQKIEDTNRDDLDYGI